MLRAKHFTDETIITIAQNHWKESDNLEQLRMWGKQDKLRCCECNTPVMVRAGQIRRRHFAHKTKITCDIGHESEILTSTRLLLYEWLSQKFGEENVEIEIPIKDVPHYIDCIVHYEGVTVAYYIIEKSIKGEEKRAELKTALKTKADHHYFIFTQSFIKEKDNLIEGDFVLTPTERDLWYLSPYTQIGRPFTIINTGEALHYLDYETEIFTTRRVYALAHSRHSFTGQTIAHPISEILIQKNGEPVHPMEHEQLVEWSKKKKIWQKRNADKDATPSYPTPITLSNHNNLSRSDEKFLLANTNKSPSSSIQNPDIPKPNQSINVPVARSTAKLKPTENKFKSTKGKFQARLYYPTMSNRPFEDGRPFASIQECVETLTDAVRSGQIPPKTVVQVIDQITGEISHEEQIE